MTLEQITQAARAAALDLAGLCHTVPGDELGDGTLVLLGPCEPGFWSTVSVSPEFKDGKTDPLDRWSNRVITELADELQGTPLFPFGTPTRPFISWALRSGQAWQSPVGLLIHETSGLLVSYRGAILFDTNFTLPETPQRPCDSCVSQDCLSACPVQALTQDGYNLPACHTYLDQPRGEACLSQGCAVRLACPISQNYPRDPAQSAFHMAAFHKPGQRDSV